MDLEWNRAQRARLWAEVVVDRPPDASEEDAKTWYDEAVEAGPAGYAGDDDLELARLGGAQGAGYARALGLDAAATLSVAAELVLASDRTSEPEKVLEVATRLVHSLLYGAGVPQGVRDSIAELVDRMTEVGVYWTIESER